jgi:DNA polymerase I-like protein with 3'-5' exonuclease and polymerase domains
VTNQQSLFELNDSIEFSTVSDCLEYFNDHKEIEVDSETTGLDVHSDKMFSLQLGDAENQYVIDTLTVPVTMFKILLETRTLLFQNAKFDLKFLYKNNIWPEKVYDTFLAECVLSMGDKSVRKGLGVLVERYAGVAMDKSMQQYIHEEQLSIRGITYAANDVKYLGIIKEKQIEKINSLSLGKALDLDNQFVRVLAYVEYCGFYLDANEWQKKMSQDLQDLEAANNVLDDYIVTNNMVEYIDNQLDLFSDEVKTNINWDSAQQVTPFLQDLGVDTKTVDKKTGKIKDSVDIKLLASQMNVHELVPKYVQYKKIGKTVQAFGESILRQIHPNTGRIHTQYKQMMDTGRMSCGGRNRATREEYVNLQQIPADERHRGCFVPESGNKLVVADYSGQESVVFANFCQDPEILAFYQQGMGDMHSFIASKIYPELEGLSLEDIKRDHKDKRQNAKAAGFAIQYGGVGKTIADNLGIPISEGDKIYDGYFEAFTGVKNYFAKVKAAVLSKGYVQLNDVSKRKSFIDFYEDYTHLNDIVKRDGFWRDYRDHKARNTQMFESYYKPKAKEYFKFQGAMERKSYNYPIQGTSAEITKLAALRFFNELVQTNCHKTVKICNIIHDEIVIECGESQADYMASRLQYHMEEAGKPFCKIIPLKATPVITDHWEH